jgi:hypothetical protein
MTEAQADELIDTLNGIAATLSALGEIADAVGDVGAEIVAAKTALLAPLVNGGDAVGRIAVVVAAILGAWLLLLLLRGLWWALRPWLSF